MRSSKSYLTVPYDLRPSKQVVRRIVLDFLQRIASCGVAVDKFQYTGMGSIHFVDHILFHRFLGIHKLVSVESDDEIAKRVKFNRPYRNIDIKIMEVGDYIPQLDGGENHIVWLDYDSRVSKSILDDVRSCAGILRPGSVVLVTVDAEAARDLTQPKDSYDWFKEQRLGLWNEDWTVCDFKKSDLHLRVLDLLGLAFREGVSGRSKINALPCFKISYADGHNMVTMGVYLGDKRNVATFRP